MLVAILAPGFEVDFTEPLCLNVWLKGGIVRLMRYARGLKRLRCVLVSTALREVVDWHLVVSCYHCFVNMYIFLLVSWGFCMIHKKHMPWCMCPSNM